jgi:hypothetical protein
MPTNFGPKMLKLKKGDFLCNVKGGTTAVCWKDKEEMYLLTNMNQSPPPTSGHYVDDEGNASKPLCIESYNSNMGFVDMSDKMANNYSSSQKTWKWTKKLFFHLVNLIILNVFIIHYSCGGTLSHKLFHERLVHGLTHAAQDINSTTSILGCGWPSSQVVHVSWLDFKHLHHWPTKGSFQRCLRASKGKVARSLYYCEGCNVGLCVYPRFKLYHTMLN